MDPEQTLMQIAEAVSKCTQCELHYSRKKAVPGEGRSDAEIMLIGEGPGFYENEQGRPFVGPAGKLLDELLANIGFKRTDVFITNIVKCRPPNNRDPHPEEINACTNSYLASQIQAINPKVIVTLGRYSMALFIPDAKISTVHGRPLSVKGRLIVPMYHPAAALHQPSLKPALMEDFSNLPELILKAASATIEVDNNTEQPEENSAENPKQLSLF